MVIYCLIPHYTELKHSFDIFGGMLRADQAVITEKLQVSIAAPQRPHMLMSSAIQHILLRSI